MTQRIALYGSGNRCKVMCEILKESDIEVITILDSNPDKWEQTINGHRIEGPDKVYELQEESICITIADFEAVKEIRRNLRQKYQYDLDREIHYNQLILEAYKQSQKIRQSIQKKWIEKKNQKDKDKNKKVIFDCYNGLILGGVEAWTIELCEALIKNGRKHTYILSDMGDYEVPSLIEKQIISVDINHQEQFSVRSVLNLIEAILDKLPCKVITCTTNEVMLAAYLVKLCYPKAIEIISVIHNSNEKSYEEYMDFIECSDLYIGVSRDIQDDMIKYGLGKDRIRSMNCPFACEPILKREYSDASEPIRIGYAGRIEYVQKRMDLLPKLIEALVKRNVDFRLELAGDGAARNDLEEVVRRNQWDEKVIFLGRLDRSKLSWFWKRQDICINMADFEGRSISILEAMGNGAVPIVTATSGVREDIREGVNGCIIPLRDYEAMAERIEELSRHRERLPGMGELAHSAVYPKSLMETHLKFWEEILN